MLMDESCRIAGIDPCEVCNGLGFGVTLFVQGCRRHCKGCHNPTTWDPMGGDKFSPIDLVRLDERCTDPNIHRLTISGGEPFESLKFTLSIALWFKENWPHKKLWIYTGYTFEELLLREEPKEILNYCDILVDGAFDIEQRDITIAFRGSRNQRIIDVPASIKENMIVELEVP